MTMAAISLNCVDLHYSPVAIRRDSLKTLLFDLVSRRPRSSSHTEGVHALRSVSLEIGAGERVGLLGHNGAGKSTLLKVIAGLYPTSGGEVKVNGHIRALFDLSLGFEPEATGRENILYRGLLLGLTPSYVRSVESEIVAFADIGEFIDLPIKTYSAGMLVRLAFAISTCVKGDILLLDEVIGAGDASFADRARRRIMQLIDRSEILVLASHDFSSLRDLCVRGIVLNRGKVVHDGPIGNAIAHYKKVSGLPT